MKFTLIAAVFSLSVIVSGCKKDEFFTANDPRLSLSKTEALVSDSVCAKIFLIHQAYLYGFNPGSPQPKSSGNYVKPKFQDIQVHAEVVSFGNPEYNQFLQLPPMTFDQTIEFNIYHGPNNTYPPVGDYFWLTLTGELFHDIVIQTNLEQRGNRKVKIELEPMRDKTHCDTVYFFTLVNDGIKENESAAPQARVASYDVRTDVLAQMNYSASDYQNSLEVQKRVGEQAQRIMRALSAAFKTASQVSPASIAKQLLSFEYLESRVQYATEKQAMVDTVARARLKDQGIALTPAMKKTLNQVVLNLQ